MFYCLQLDLAGSIGGLSPTYSGLWTFFRAEIYMHLFAIFAGGLWEILDGVIVKIPLRWISYITYIYLYSIFQVHRLSTDFSTPESFNQRGSGVNA